MTQPGFVYAGEFDVEHTRELRDKRYHLVDLSGSTFRDCSLENVSFNDCIVSDVVINGDVSRLVVNDVDVTDYVEGQLDERYPERVPIRALRATKEPTVADVRAIAELVSARWAGVIARADALPEALRQERVKDEWSIVETLRHLTFCIDAWISRTVLDEERPYHPLGFPAGGYPRDDAAEIGLDLDAAPTYAEARAAWASRIGVLTRVIDGLTEDELLRMCVRNPAPGYPTNEVPVFRCVRVALDEHTEHARYAERDLSVLEQAPQ